MQRLLRTQQLKRDVFPSNLIPPHPDVFFDYSSLIQRNIPAFISKDVWPAKSPDLNPMDFSIWFILEKWILATPHTSLESLKARLRREREAIPQEQIRAACDAFVNRLKAVVHNKGGYNEEI
ncbi:hypothetical protein FHG87_001820 [Trinorchestia longiramus]|nr:hypothetical protein FHG87_001820 [Trinorchestia longiramus]